MSNRLEEGVGATTAAGALPLMKPLDFTGNVWYVSSVSGNDAAAPAGKDRKYPLATLGQAITNSSAGDMIVLLSDHDETIASALTISSQVWLTAEGASAGVPTAQLTLNHASADMITISAARTHISGIKFNIPDQATTGSMVVVSGDDVSMENCYFELDENNDDYAVKWSGANGHIENTTGIVVEATAGSHPFPWMEAAATADGLRTNGLVLDGGTVGFQDGSGDQYALDATAGQLDAVEFRNLSLLKGAVLGMHALSTGFIEPKTVTGGGRVEWAA